MISQAVHRFWEAIVKHQVEVEAREPGIDLRIQWMRRHERGILVAQAIRNAIRANRFARIIRNSNLYFYSASGQFAQITRISDSRESLDSRESCESIRANHATKRGMHPQEGLFVCGNASDEANEPHFQIDHQIEALPGTHKTGGGG